MGARDTRVHIKGGTVVTGSGARAADVICDGETIADIIPPNSAAGPRSTVFDARGLLVFPGFIDPHVHSRDPGLTYKDNIERTTRSAAAGGITTVLDMPNSVPAVTDSSQLRSKSAAFAGRAFVDYGLWGMSLGESNIAALEGLTLEGAVAIKLFWGYSFSRRTGSLVYTSADAPGDDLIPPPGSGEMLAVFEEIARVGGLLAAHCEHPDIIAWAEGHAESIRTHADLIKARPESAEAVAVAVGIELARSSGGRFHVVHLSSRRGAELVRRARRDGLSVSAETCPHYLLLEVNSGATDVKVYPPIRGEEHRNALWDAIRDGTIESVGSDHSPHSGQEKRRSLAARPAGGLGTEVMGTLMVGAMSDGRLTPEQLAWTLSEGTARLYGLYPNKGAIEVGSDADFTFVDPARPSEIDSRRLHSKFRVTPWHGWKTRGAVVGSLLRGRQLSVHGRVTSDRRGRFTPSGRPRDR